mmetsp:Transcript_25605/g.46372  ORF Transcript_25605/g.46372 Transcript_25605/m.46372 type:complete len:425 (-) Transcript_25605:53-1327(-)
MGFFVDRDGAVTPAAFLLVVGGVLVAIGYQYTQDDDYQSTSHYVIFGKPIQLLIGSILIGLGLIADVWRRFGNTSSSVGKDETLAFLPAEEILNELNKMKHEGTIGDSVASETEKKEIEKLRLKKSVNCLDALAMKCGREQTRRNKLMAKAKTEGDELNVNIAGKLSYEQHELEILCQDAVYIVLDLYPCNDDAVSAAISLLALIAKDEEVRRRHIEEADKFGLNVPVKAMRDALKRAKIQDAEDSEEARKVEWRSAELQRKGCLMIGALADGDPEMATKLVDEDGLKAALDAMEWYRFHSEVANWSLWCVFCICYDHMGNKGSLVMKLGGIQRICRAMKDLPTSLDVARHGIAILFDLMREVPENPTALVQIRTIALNAGVHDVLSRAMEEFDDSVEIMMMGQQMLYATGYQGNIPHYRPRET